jgi:hypothetical protein
LKATPTTYQGNMGVVETTNGICSTQMSSQGFACRIAVSFLEYTGTRTIGNFPFLYGFPTTAPIVGPTGISIGVWNTATDAPTLTITTDLLTAGALTDLVVPRYWSGLESKDCDGWESTSAPTGGEYGINSATNFAWIVQGSAIVCSNAAYLMCACIQGDAAPTTNSPTTPFPTPP